MRPVGVLGGALAFLWQAITKQREWKHERSEKVRERKLDGLEKQRERNLALRESEREGNLALREKEREQRRANNDKLRDELASLVLLYNDVKSVRRNLRSLGLDVKTYPAAQREDVRGTRRLTKEQASGFHEQMLILSGLQLSFEAKLKQFGQTNLLEGDNPKVVTLIGGIENHLNNVLDLWEQRGWDVSEGTTLSVVYDGLVGLFRVPGYFGPHVSQKMREIMELINKHVFNEASTDTQNALKTALSKHADDESGDTKVAS